MIGEELVPLLTKDIALLSYASLSGIFGHTLTWGYQRHTSLRQFLDYSDEALRLHKKISTVQMHQLALVLSGSRHWKPARAIFSQLPLPIFIVIVVVVIVTLTEFASNTASTAMSVPILAATATSMGLSPLVLAIPATVAASCAFMLPAATPPNAIVFGTGYFTVPQMVKAGIGVNLIGVILISLLTLLLARPLFGV